MRKYIEVSKLTDEFLQGTLKRLEIEYENVNDVIVAVSYEDEHSSKIDYKVRINDFDTVDFLSHQCRDSYGKFALNRDANFETALTEYLVNA